MRMKSNMIEKEILKMFFFMKHIKVRTCLGNLTFLYSRHPVYI